DAAGALPVLARQLGGELALAERGLPQRAALLALGDGDGPAEGAMALGVQGPLAANQRQHGAAVEGDGRERLALAGPQVVDVDREEAALEEEGAQAGEAVSFDEERPAAQPEAERGG